MNTLTRKQREIQQREQLILDIGLKLLGEEGYANLTMDKVAELAEYSKGTIYQHFRSKEDLMSAICIRANDRMQALFQVVQDYDAPSRQKLVALYFAYQYFINTHPVEFENIQHLHNCAATEKMCPMRKDQLDHSEQETMCVASSVVQEAIEQGDITNRGELSAEDISFYLWVASFGLNTMLRTKIPIEDLGIRNPVTVLLQSNDAFLDGIGWKPSSKEKSSLQYLAAVEIDLQKKMAEALGD